jgi:hypothetical protein
MLRNVLLAFIPLWRWMHGLLPVFAEKRQVIYSHLTGACWPSASVPGAGHLRLLGILWGLPDRWGPSCSASPCRHRLPGLRTRRPGADLGAVPLGTPLIAGPAVLATSLAIIQEYGLWATLISIVVNVALCGVLLGLSGVLLRFLGRPGSRALSKITSLLLGAIAVMLIRKGIVDLLGRM